MQPHDSNPRVLVFAPDVSAELAETLSEHAHVTSVDRQGLFLDALGGAPWRGVVWAVGDAADFPLIPRVVAALDGGVLVVTHPRPTVDRVVDAEAAGAACLVSHPPDAVSLVEMLRPYLTEDGDHPIPSDSVPDQGVVGSSPALADAYRTVARVARSATPVLVVGPSGTGKELVARALHDRSDRNGAPFVSVNCAALPEGLLEAELFGHERGAFTGAVGRSEGRFGRAHGGTLFLDEIGEMGLGVQAKLLRALDSGEIERLGSGQTVRVDARIVAATNRDLAARVREGAFREDLLYRLAVVTIPLPSLADRPEDLLPLAETFAARFARQHGRTVHAFSDAALRRLRERTWPGNVRELRNALDRAVLLARGGVIRSVDLAEEDGVWEAADPVARGDGYDPTLALREVEERHMRRVLAHTGGHLGEAARILGIHRNTMTVKVREYGIDPDAPGDRFSGSGVL